MAQIPPRLKPPPSNTAITIVLSIVLLVFCAVGGIIGVAVWAPDALLVAIPAIIGFVLSIVTTLLTLLRSNENAAKLDGLHVDLNSRLTELLATTSKAQRAEGVVEGRTEGREVAQEAQ